MEQPIIISKYLSEKRNDIFGECAEAIKNGLKIHFNSPVGSGKTTMAIEIMEKYPDKNFVVLFPQISISEQVWVKLVAKGHEAVIVNSRTINKVVADNKQAIKNRIMLTTVDSTYKLIEGLNLAREDTVVIMDETHTFLQSPRDSHTRSIQMILDSGFPVIGFSATPSSWVNKFLLGVDYEIEFQFKEDRSHKVYQTTVKRGLTRTIAQEITSDSNGMTIVFVENISDQKQLKRYINEYDASLKVCWLNSETKSTIHKTQWQHLMNHDSLPAGYDVYLINSVAQAGVNITNKDIHRVYLVGCFDPFGFAQYLGRCRNYTKSYHYYNSTYGKQLEAFDYNKIQERIDFITEVLTSNNKQLHKLLKALRPTISDQIYQDEKNNLVVDKCKVANSVYNELRGLSGDDLILVTESLFPDIEFTCMQELDGITITSTSSQQTSRKNAQVQLKDYIIRKHDYINQLAVKMNYDNSETNMKLTIDKYFTANGLRIFQKREKTLRDIQDLIKVAQMSPSRLIAINSMYRQSRNHEGVLNELMKLNGNKLNDINEAIGFFAGITASVIKTMMKEIYHQVGELLSATEWRKLLKSEVPNPTGSDKLLKNLYKFCLQTKRSNGQQKLIKINETIDDYLESFDFKHLTYFQGKLSPK